MVKKKAVRKIKRTKAKVKRAVKKPKIKKAGSRKGASKKTKIKAPKAPEIMLEKIGRVTHYFPHVNAAAVIILKNSLKVGEEIYIKGHTTDFKEKVDSMQLDHVPVQEGKKKQEIGLRVKSRVRIGDSVYKV